MTSKRAIPRRQDRGAPGLLLTFVAATVTMVAAVAVIGLTDSDWADVGAIVLLLGMLGLLMAAIRRELREEEPSSPDDAGAPR